MNNYITLLFISLDKTKQGLSICLDIHPYLDDFQRWPWARGPTSAIKRRLRPQVPTPTFSDPPPPRRKRSTAADGRRRGGPSVLISPAQSSTRALKAVAAQNRSVRAIPGDVFNPPYSSPVLPYASEKKKMYREEKKNKTKINKICLYIYICI